MNLYGRRYRDLRKAFLRRCRVNEVPCHICHQTIDYEADGGTENAFELDHFYPVTTHPHLCWEPSNFRASHSKCNRSRQAETMARRWQPANW